MRENLPPGRGRLYEEDLRRREKGGCGPSYRVPEYIPSPYDARPQPDRARETPYRAEERRAPPYERRSSQYDGEVRRHTMSRDRVAVRSFGASNSQAYEAAINLLWLYGYRSLRTLASDMNP
jgi:hypothetical protein